MVLVYLLTYLFIYVKNFLKDWEKQTHNHREIIVQQLGHSSNGCSCQGQAEPRPGASFGSRTWVAGTQAFGHPLLFSQDAGIGLYWKVVHSGPESLPRWDAGIASGGLT